jgi:hypothetical protein
MKVFVYKLKLKEMKKTVVIIFGIILFVTNIWAQKSETRKIQPFSKISVFGSFDVVITKGDSNFIKLESESVNLANIKVENDKNTLNISVTDKLFDKYRNIKVFITYKELNGIKANGGSYVSSKQIVKTDSIDIIAGSGSTVDLKIETNSITADIGEGSTISLEGTCKKQSIEAGTGGLYNSYDLKCKNTTAKANTGGIIKAAAYESLDAYASTGGSISYRGNPQNKKEKTVLGGSVEQLVE